MILVARRTSSLHHPPYSPRTQNKDLDIDGLLSSKDEEKLSDNNHMSSQDSSNLENVE